MSRIDSKIILRKAAGVFLLLVTVGLATCQSVVNSFAGAELPAAAERAAVD